MNIFFSYCTFTLHNCIFFYLYFCCFIFFLSGNLPSLVRLLIELQAPFCNECNSLVVEETNCFKGIATCWIQSTISVEPTALTAQHCCLDLSTFSYSTPVGFLIALHKTSQFFCLQLTRVCSLVGKCLNVLW